MTNVQQLIEELKKHPANMLVGVDLERISEVAVQHEVYSATFEGDTVLNLTSRE